MKKITLIILLSISFACKSTQSTKKNKLDVVTVQSENLQQEIKLEQLTLSDFEINLKTADPKKPVTITDKKGNQQTFENVASVQLKKKKETATAATKKEAKESNKKTIDNSTINEAEESVSDTNNYKWIFMALACIFGFVFFGYLIFKFKK